MCFCGKELCSEKVQGNSVSECGKRWTIQFSGHIKTYLQVRVICTVFQLTVRALKWNCGVQFIQRIEITVNSLELFRAQLK